MPRDLRSERLDYSGSLLPEPLDGFDPFAQFAAWMDEAFAEQAAGRLAEPAAMVLSTVAGTGDDVRPNALRPNALRPSARVVLLKGWDEHGFVFFTHHDSAKGEQLAQCPNASLLFWWPSLMRQIRVEGPVAPTSRDESESYFAERPRGSQVGAWASRQSRPREFRASLADDVAAAEIRFADAEQVPCPPNWGGYRLVPDRFEFWQGQPSRLHDRVVADRDLDAWSATRLDP